MTLENRQRLKYIVADFVSTNIALAIFNIVRYYDLPLAYTNFNTLGAFLTSTMPVLGQLFFPIGMMFLYYLSGFYNNVFVKSRTQEFSVTFITALLGTVSLIFLALLNDLTNDRARDYSLFLWLFLLLFGLVYIPRLIITWQTIRKVWSGRISFPSAVVGYSSSPELFAHQLKRISRATGMKVTAYIDADNRASSLKGLPMPVHDLKDIRELASRQPLDSIIVIPHPGGWSHTLEVINKLFPVEKPIYMGADSLPSFMFRTHLLTITSQPLIDISSSHLSASTLNIKRVFDVTLATLGAVITAVPVLALAVAVRLTSKGPAFYVQQRVGRHGRLFNMVKLRTMVADAEADGVPALSSDGDRRITPLGRFLRKYRLDELPQLYNVIRGDMSIVGPRPERPYFAEQLMEREPSYALLRSLRPGVTSLGMVNYGYASSVDQMMERMRYDLLYLENISLVTDLKVIIHTVHTVFSGKGV